MTTTEVGTFQLSPNSVVFRTDGTWFTDDFRRFIIALEGLYTAFLAVHLAEAELSKAEEQVSTYRREVNNYYDLQVRAREQGWTDFPPVPPLNVFSFLAADQSRYVAFVYDNIRTLARDEQLAIGVVRMDSPGWISFQGLGEPIQQLRELIKDLWYRNKQERELGRLEIARQHLQLQRDYGDLLQGPANKIPVAALEQADVLERLESEGKLVNVPDNVDPETFDPNTG